MNTVFLILFLVIPVFIGMAIAFMAVNQQGKGLKLLLSFGGAYLLGISFLHLIPEIYLSSGAAVGIFILVGFLLQLLLEFLSQGIEHGHSHAHDHSHGFPALLFISLCIHAFIEAVPLEREVKIAAMPEHSHSGISLLAGIAIHNIPLTVALTATLLCYHVKKTKVVIWIGVFALCGPAGALIGRHFHYDLMLLSPAFFDYAMGLVIGMFLHISTTILFESSEGHRFNAIKLLAVLTGFAVSYVSSAI
ncbi:MAG: ZIP family metal transporter [Flavobacteriales bacterium]